MVLLKYCAVLLVATALAGCASRKQPSALVVSGAGDDGGEAQAGASGVAGEDVREVAGSAGAATGRDAGEVDAATATDAQAGMDAEAADGGEAGLSGSAGPEQAGSAAAGGGGTANGAGGNTGGDVGAGGLAGGAGQPVTSSDCPLGPSTDADGNGYPDACETTLWQADAMDTLDVMPAVVNPRASFCLSVSCPMTLFGREVESAQTTTRIYDVASNPDAAAFVACVNNPKPSFAGGATVLELWSNGSSTGSPHLGPLGDPLTGFGGKHVYYFVRTLTFSAPTFTDRFGAVYNHLSYTGRWRAVGY